MKKRIVVTVVLIVAVCVAVILLFLNADKDDITASNSAEKNSVTNSDIFLPKKESEEITYDKSLFTDVIFEKRNGVYEQTGIGVCKKSGEAEQPEYWVINQDGKNFQRSIFLLSVFFSKFRLK